MYNLNIYILLFHQPDLHVNVKALYTNIPHKDGVKACFEALETRIKKSPPSRELVKLLELTLNSNNFTFNDTNYLQVSGTLMGGKYAPSYAIIFMGHLEKNILTSATKTPLVWFRYIDDIFLIWTHTKEDLSEFIVHANSLHPTIKFTSEHSTSQVPFLDVLVKLTPDNTLETDLYTKPTDKHMYLQPSSCHPNHITKNIPYSLSLRLRRICSDDETLKHRTYELKSQLKNRGYTKISQQINKAKVLKRDDTLKYKSKTHNNRVPLVTTYYPNLPNLNATLRRYWPIIESHPRLQKAIPELPIISYRRPKNIRDSLVQAKIKSPQIQTQTPPSTSQACNNKRCVTCQHFDPTPTDSFTSHITGISYPIRNDATCLSSNVVYLIQCSKCGIQYVGETGTTVRLRMANHRSTIKNHTKHIEKPVASHFSQPGHNLSHFRLIIIECLGKQPKVRRQLREKHWIVTLDTYDPKGLNIREK